MLATLSVALTKPKLADISEVLYRSIKLSVENENSVKNGKATKFPFLKHNICFL